MLKEYFIKNTERNSNRTHVGRSQVFTDPEEFAALEKEHEYKLEKQKKKAEAAECRAPKNK